jgi:DNA-directed RNA polymerase subunit RPC12/RpoP
MGSKRTKREWTAAEWAAVLKAAGRFLWGLAAALYALSELLGRSHSCVPFRTELFSTDALNRDWIRPRMAILHRKTRMNQKIGLRVVTAPPIGHVVDAPPVLRASEHSADYSCGRCGTVLLHADEGQVHGLLIRCKECGSYNTTDG